jgi:hypothetical protein
VCGNDTDMKLDSLQYLANRKFVMNGTVFNQHALLCSTFISCNFVNYCVVCRTHSLLNLVLLHFTIRPRANIIRVAGNQLILSSAAGHVKTFSMPCSKLDLH